jgi:ergothioneine biosynthesis protein EgtB
MDVEARNEAAVEAGSARARSFRWDARPLQARFLRVRGETLTRVNPLSAEDCCAQSMPDASPAKWHMAHTTWFFETFVLVQFDPDYAPVDPGYRHLFNSYYDAIGSRHPRPQRGLLTRPSLDEVLSYRRLVDERVTTLLDTALPTRALELIELGIQHEQQHQELLMTDVLHLFAQHPLSPAYRAVDADSASQASAARPAHWLVFDGGLAWLGHQGQGFCFDNELPRHRVWLEPYVLADRLVSCGEYARFIDAGGYRDPRWWLAEGWDWLQRERIAQPIYWRGDAIEGWREFTLAGEQPLDPARPVGQLSYYEADAYARWAGARLPTEAEWEHAAGRHAAAAACADQHAFALRPCAATQGDAQFLAPLWQWTSSSYAPYPGFAPPSGAVGEYNGKFMVNQYVLRGGSCATPPEHARSSYRNFFPATARWQFSGLRLARSR